MVFRECSIGGAVYHGDPEEDEDLGVKKVDDPNGEQDMSRDSSFGSTSAATPPVNPDNINPPTIVKLSSGVFRHFSDQQLKQDLARAVNAEPGSENEAQARALNGFFSVLALCHTVLTAVDPETGIIEYKAQSPDEAALVQAAADVGFVFRGREREILMLQTPFSKEIERYELLDILEFTSVRKRMSIIVRKLDGHDSRLFLLTKGADSVIFERLKSGGDELKRTTERHLDDFANAGLRTLTLAYKVIPGTYSLFIPLIYSSLLHSEDEYENWSERYHEASTALEDRTKKVEDVSDEMERDLRLLGATAIEDRLQDGVPETIADLKLAGIKIWVATGDKLETAIGMHSFSVLPISTDLFSVTQPLATVRISSQTTQISSSFVVGMLDLRFTARWPQLSRSSSRRIAMF